MDPNPNLDPDPHLDPDPNSSPTPTPTPNQRTLVLNRYASGAGRSSLNLTAPPAAPAAFSGRRLVSNASASDMADAGAGVGDMAGVGALPASPTRAALQEAARADVVHIVGAPGSRDDAAAIEPAVEPEPASNVGAASPDAGAGVGAGVGATLPSPPPSPPPSFQARRGSSPPRVQHEGGVSGTTPGRPWSGATLPASPPGSGGNAPAPDAFSCPIGHTVMTDPVTCADGHSYQVEAGPRPSPLPSPRPSP